MTLELRPSCMRRRELALFSCVLGVVGSGVTWACGSRSSIGLVDDMGGDGGTANGRLDSSAREVESLDAPLGPEARDDSTADALNAECSPGSTRCSGIDVETCGPDGRWGTPWVCTTGACNGGGCVGLTTTGTSCQTSGDGLTNCGGSQESCCTSLEVPGGTFFRTYDPLLPGYPVLPDMDYNDAIALSVEGGPADEADPATVSGFRLDEYLVTVGRFRRFVRAWNGGSGLDGGPGYLPAAGSGKHTYLNGGLGLANSVIPGTYETGWVASDDAYVAPTDDNLACNALGLTPSRATWTSSAGGNETLPINCVLREEAYAFCIWDGGFLPSDAEWEYAAAGGSQQRKYPWGGADPGLGDAYAIYGGHYDGNTVAPVGTASPLGVARWGQVDLSGDVFEWNLDVSPSSFDPCTDCANLTHLRGGSGLVARGGSFYAASIFLVPSCQLAQLPLPGHRFEEMGFRCARAP